MEPSREILWNIPLGTIIYTIAPVALALMVYAFYRHYKIWHLGKADARLTGRLLYRWKQFLRATLIDGILHRKLFGVGDNLGHRRLTFKDLKPQEFYPGLSHFLIGIGFALLLLGTAMDVVSHYVYGFLSGDFYLAYSLFTDIAGIMVLLGAVMFFIRRYVRKPARLDNQRGDLVALLLIFLITVTGFIIEGLRIAAAEMADHPAWSPWSPGGYLLAKAFISIAHPTLLVWHRTFWWLHSLITFGTMFYLAFAFDRLWHIILSPLNIFYRNLGLRGAIEFLDLEKAPSFGVSRVADFSWKHLLDLEACTRCGRCQDSCPAYLSGKPLSPKAVIQDLKANLLEQAPALLKAKRTAAPPDPDLPSAPAACPAEKPLIGGVVSQDAIWNCTTCYACQEVCPVWIEPMSKLIEMRRNLVLEQAAIPQTGEGALRSIEDRGHPWRGTQLTRTSWLEGLDIKPLAENKEVDILYWVGCTSALEDRSLKVARATARLLKQAGVRFGVLGDEESCCGDPARRLGNEYLYQMQARKNIETLKKYRIQKIVTGCPHCYNTLKNEYPQLNGQFEVIHHTEFLLQLIREGRLKPAASIRGSVTYQDACYLGRYNNLFEAPRQLIRSLPGVTLKEMARCQERSFCCGGGGGHLWLEEQKVGERINVMRTEQALATLAGIVATACPYCLQMFQDGIKTKEAEATFKVMDIAELLIE